jgi:diaminopropionate ammonia-lyase
MRDLIKWTENNLAPSDCVESLELIDATAIAKVRTFHASIPQYSPTPLAQLDALAGHLGIKGLYVKDESYRFGLNAFKVLGGSYAIGVYLAKLLGKDISELSYEELVSPKTRAEVGEITFYTTTDGNHGRGVAWAAHRLRQKAVVYMPAGSSETRLENIRREGAEAFISLSNYDDTVRSTAALAEMDPQGVMVQDTAWPGYTEIPGWIMQGYSTMAAEANDQLAALGLIPTHVFVQAGVGSLAGAVQGFFSNTYQDACPTTVIVEAAAADNLYRSALAKELVAVGGELKTIMAGLACGEGNVISWEILKNEADFFVSAPDWVSAEGMRILAAPLKGDAPVLSGESGAVGVGLLSVILTDERYRDFKEAVGLNEDSVVLCFSTEGNTDPDLYHKIVWQGYCPSFEEVQQ